MDGPLWWWYEWRKMKVHKIFAPAVIAAALLFSGCAAAVQQPEVRFDGLRLGSVGLRGGMLYAQVYVMNPNRFGFEAEWMTYDLELAAPGTAAADGPRWVRMAEGTFREPIRVGARDSVRIEVPIEFTYAQLDGALRSVLDRGMVNYRVRGEVRISDPVGRTVPYGRVGEVGLSGVRQ
jgi:LEA14-like dessication related protein